MSFEIETQLEFRDYESLKKNFKFDDERITTATSLEQKKTEASIGKCFDRYAQMRFLRPNLPKFQRSLHLRFLEAMLHHLPTSYECLDCSRPWNLYWALQAAHTLNFSFADETLEHVVQFLIKCRHPRGGFAGGPSQYPHLATTYAAVNVLCIIGTPSAYRAIDRDTLVPFLFSCREPDGSFRLDVDGETDVRGAYCALSAAKLSNVPADVLAKLFDKTGDWIASCQTYEGGFGGAPDLEAHGGYTFCAIAALALLNEGHKCDTHELLKWTLKRQMSYEGGFQGRTNKLVDGCYSFWVGATVAITQAVIARKAKDIEKALFDVAALQEYILLCCQSPNGGLIDKPGKPQDLYHTCYCLSGLAVAQHLETPLNPQVLGEPCNEVLPTHPLFNVPPRAVAAALDYFDKHCNCCSSTSTSSSNNSNERNERKDSQEGEDSYYANNIDDIEEEDVRESSVSSSTSS